MHLQLSCSIRLEYNCYAADHFKQDISRGKNKHVTCLKLAMSAGQCKNGVGDQKRFVFSFLEWVILTYFVSTEYDIQRREKQYENSGLCNIFFSLLGLRVYASFVAKLQNEVRTH